MKKLALLALLVVGAATPINADGTCCNNNPVVNLSNCCACQVSSRSFFTIRPLYQPASPELESLSYYKMDEVVDGRGGFVEATLFGSKSTNRANMAAYFMFNCQTQLVVKEDQTDPNKDILAGEFNIITQNGDFESIISFAPQQTVYGVGITYRQAFARWGEAEFWFGISSPLTRVHNTVGFNERIINDGGGVASVVEFDDETPAPNMQAAFKQANWTHGRIDCACEKAKTYLGDIAVEVGYEYFKQEYAHVESHAGILIPTGNEVRSITVFEPIVGRNKHFGLSFGSSGGLEIRNNPDVDSSVWMELQFYGVFLLPHTEVRLVDLKGKPWSRYMEVYKNMDEAQLAANSDDVDGYTPGVNVFALPLCVKPGFQRSILMSLVYSRCAWQLEGGYNLYCRPAECVQLKYPWQEGPALKALGGRGYTNNQLNIQGGFTNELISIDALDKPVADYNDNLILQSDLDLQSASHPCMISHTFYGTFGYEFERPNYPLFIGFGGSYEFTEDNTGINRFVGWGKFGVAF